MICYMVEVNRKHNIKHCLMPIDRSCEGCGCYSEQIYEAQHEMQMLIEQKDRLKRDIQACLDSNKPIPTVTIEDYNCICLKI